MSSDIKWVSLNDLKEPFNDAFNYRSRHEKDLFNKLFLQTKELNDCIAPSKYFLMGEKGSGKTAYAVYLENNVINGFKCQVTTMTETQYKRFIALKREGRLAYSDYANIWRSMLLFLVGKLLVSKSKTFLSGITGKFRSVEREIEKWTKNALNPEVESAFEAITSAEFGGEITTPELAKVAGKVKSKEREEGSKLKHHLLETENALREAITSLSLREGHVLFVDGIDYRPEAVPYRDYLECVKGLAEAVWQLNTEFFNTIKDSPGRIKIVLLVRPDVFHALNVYNSNSRLQDNTIYLDWSTNELEYRESPLYELSGRYFSRQQQSSNISPQEAWNHYYQDDQTGGAAFKRLLRTTFQKPRDILTFIKLTRDIQLKACQGDANVFPVDIATSANFTRAYSDYLLGEARNYAAFYMTQSDFRSYMKFFQYLDGRRRFTFEEFSSAYTQFRDWAKGEDIKAKEYLQDADALLQFFYDANLIGYTETASASGGTYYHWSYRERSPNEIAPKVKSTSELVVNPGIAKALDIGTTFQKTKKSSNSRSSPRQGRRSHRGRGRRK